MDARALLTSIVENNVRAVGLDLHEADLAGAPFANLRAEDLDLRGANIRRAQLRGARFDHCWLGHINMSQADLSNATFRLCVLDGAQAPDACCDGARIEDSTAVGADLSRASLCGAHLTETSFSRALLRATILDNADGDGVDFRGSDLRAASLKGVRFNEADFRGADLGGADLSHGRFRAADFRGALLDNTNFTSADLKGAVFDRDAGPDLTEPAALPDSILIDALGGLLALLPNVVAGAKDPSKFIVQTERLIGKLAKAAGYSVEQQQALQKHLTDITFNGPPPQVLERLVARLNSRSDQLPEELQAWLEPLMRATSGETLNHLIADVSNDLPPELKTLLETILRAGKP